MDDLKQKALKLHKDNLGKIEVNSKISIKNQEDLSLAYSPGVAEPCKEIFSDPEKIYDYTAKSTMTAVISDGSAVLGLGNIGAKASLPVMEGKCILLKEFAGVNSFPICIDTQEPEELINIIKNLGTSFGAIVLEDICAPKCFEIENKLKEIMEIPVFHDDQHGTSIVVAGALINATKLANKEIKDLKVAQSGTGAAGINIIKMLSKLGVKNIKAFNKNGVVNSSNKSKNDKYVNELLEKNIILDNKDNTLADIIKNTDLFIGVSVANIVTKEMIQSMNDKPIIFALANPNPEIDPKLALEAGAFIVGTGRSDVPNQINNVLAFPGLIKAAIKTKKQISDEDKIAAAIALANCVPSEELNVNKIIPSPFQKSVHEEVYKSVLNLHNKK